jgi:hypothetical protein
VTIEPCVSRDVSASCDRDLVEVPVWTPDTSSNVKQQGQVAEWRPSAVGISETAVDAHDDKRRVEGLQRKVVDGSIAPKLTGSGRRSPTNVTKKSLDDPSSVAAVVFGLQLLRHALRKEMTPGESDTGGSQQLDPFVPLLTECVCHCRDSEAVLLAMRCLSDIRGKVAKLPAFDASSKVLASKTLDLLVGFGGNEELLQASFKMMAFLIEGGEGHRRGTPSGPPGNRNEPPQGKEKLN